MDPSPPQVLPGQRIERGPERVRSELRWTMIDPAGLRFVVARLADELAHEPVVRARYVRDRERLAALPAEVVAATIAVGPSEPDATEAPWRARREPDGEPLDRVLARRAPMPTDEVAALGSELCRILAAVHAAGWIVRDPSPRTIVVQPDGRAIWTDIGLARVDLLSTRTAASLVLEGSPYAAPEQLLGGRLDPRSDLFGIGVILHRAATGILPFPEDALIVDRTRRPADPRTVVPSLPPSLAAAILACLEFEPGARPGGAELLGAILDGRAVLDPRAHARTPCQACGAPLRLGQRLCTECGREAVQFHHLRPFDPAARDLVLTKIDESAPQSAALDELLRTVSSDPIPSLNFVHGHRGMYSKDELAERFVLPSTLFRNLRPDTAEALATRLRAAGMKVRIREPGTDPTLRNFGILAAITVVAGLIAGLTTGSWIAAAITAGVLGIIAVAIAATHLARNRHSPLALGPFRLRAAPAALPASDPLVSRLAVLLQRPSRPDLHDLVGELALAVQRVVDRRAELASADAATRADFGRITAPVADLVVAIEREIGELQRIDAALAGGDEGELLRALERERLRDGSESALLARLAEGHELEERRGTAMTRLLRAADLLRRSAARGLEVHDEDRVRERDVEAALAVLAIDPESP